MLALIFAHVVASEAPQQMRVLADSARLATVLVEYDAGGKHHLAIVRGTSEELDVPGDVCGVGADAKKASAALSRELRKHDITEFGVACTALPTSTKASDQGSLRVAAVSDGKQQVRTLFIDDVPVFLHKDDASAVTTYLVSGSYGRVVLEWVDGDGKFRVAGALPRADKNGVDVAGLSALKSRPECAVSVATNIPLENTVAVTVAFALKSKVPVTESQTTREKSVVFASDKCVDVANAIAAKVPGGATTEQLTWKAAGNAGIVVALGDTATSK